MSRAGFRWAALALVVLAVALAAGFLRRTAPLDSIDAVSEAALEDVLDRAELAP